jgi:hypothetical protein
VDGVEADGLLYRQQATKYAGKGYVVLLVHYFDRTGGTKENRRLRGPARPLLRPHGRHQGKPEGHPGVVPALF